MCSAMTVNANPQTGIDYATSSIDIKKESSTHQGSSKTVHANINIEAFINNSTLAIRAICYCGNVTVYIYNDRNEIISMTEDFLKDDTAITSNLSLNSGTYMVRILLGEDSYIGKFEII